MTETGSTGSSVRRLAGIVVASGLPVAGLGLFWEQAKEHPVLAAVLTVGYLALAAAAAFARDVGRELRQRWTSRAADRADTALRLRVSRFAHRYRQVVLASLRYIDLRGHTVVGFYTPELDEVYVDVSLGYEAPAHVRADLLGGHPGGDGRLRFRDLVGRPKPLVLALLGPPGSGKTTALRHMARRSYRRRPGRRPVPILLFLHDHAAAIAADPGLSLADVVARHVAGFGLENAADWFDRRLRAGDCVVLLDGLDEVPGDPSVVASWIARQTTRYPRNDFVVSSRPQGYRAAPIPGAVVVRVRGFADDQVAAFVRAWYAAVERRAGADRAAARERADALLDRLRRTPELHDLTVNPLLLTMIANVHRERGVLPGSRVELYAEICRVALGRRRSTADLPEHLLRRQAFALMERQVRDVSRADLLAALRRSRRGEARPAEELLAGFVDCGLLVEREAGTFAFAHHTLQEYLAAEHIRAEGKAAVPAGRVDDPWWREVTLLHVARGSADDIVRACLTSGSITALVLAMDCADEGAALDPLLRKEVERAVDGLFAADADPERRRLLAGALVARELRSTVSISDTAAVCRAPVSERVLALCRGRLPVDGGTEVASGVSSRAADGLITWLNQGAGHGVTYRLPRREELSLPEVRSVADHAALGSLWLADGENRLWTNYVSGDPWKLFPADIPDRVALQAARSWLIVLRAILVIGRWDGDGARELLQDLRSGTLLGPPPPGVVALGVARDLTPLVPAVSAHPGAFSEVVPYLIEVLDTARDDVGHFISRGDTRIIKALRGRGARVDLPARTTFSDLPAVSAAMGSVLAASLEHHRTWVSGQLATPPPLHLVGVPSPREAPYRVLPDDLDAMIPATCSAARDRRHPEPGSWPAHALGVLEGIGRRLADREPVDRGDLRDAITVALCVAGEHPVGPDTEAWWRIAAGFKTLARRREGTVHEAVLLVAD